MESKLFLKRLNKQNNQFSGTYPTKLKVHGFLIQLSNLLFPICKELSWDEESIEVQWNKLRNMLSESLKNIKITAEKSKPELVDSYFKMIPFIYDQLLDDARAILEFDPAAYSIEEIILAYPGFQAIMTYRLAHPLYQFGIPILPRLLSEYAHSTTGIDIHPGAQIGKSFFIDHGTGIVIGETTIIGDHVKIYQGVTLGALNVRKSEAKSKRHPTIEDRVIIYSGTTILGGNTCIGHDSVIGGNVWLTKSIEPFSVVYNKSEIRVCNGNKNNREAINFII